MTDPNYPSEAQHFGRSQTPESPRPMHIPEPSNIPVLENQLDSVFNDTSTYDNPRASQPLALTSHAENTENTAPDTMAAAFANESSFELKNGPPQVFTYDSTIVDHALLPLSPTEATITSIPSQGPTAPNASEGYPPVPRDPDDESDPYDPSLPSQTFSSTKLAIPEATVALSDADADRSNHSPILPAHEHAALMTQDELVKSHGQGVDYQSLLDQLSNATAIAPSADNITAPTTDVLNNVSTLAEKPLQPISGLPPKPPPRENESASANLSEYQHFYTSGPHTASNVLGQTSDVLPMNRNVASADNAFPEPSAVVGASGLPPPPQISGAQNPFLSYHPSEPAPGDVSSTADRPWSPRTQVVYDEFLDDERMYVTEGVWDRFPAGSRLFVGNLPTEKVTKRDLFHVFHRHGKLAQISIKQAYGFVQFLDAQSCHNALLAEQDSEIRGRKVHLEVSKPQKNTRPAGGLSGRSNNRRRSRSPVRRDTRLPFSDFRDEPGRRRDDYRPRRSPSPRGYRSRDELRTRSPRSHVQYDSRPGSSVFGSTYRLPSPPPFDEDVALPLPRRAPQDVPDVQVLVFEEVAPQFVNYVEQGFRQKGLKASTIWLNPRLTLEAVIKRQIREGVQAVVKLSRANQYNSKVPLQVFDRTQGASNVRFNEYVDLDITVAADVVIHQRQKERTVPQTPAPVSYAHNAPFNPQPTYNFPAQHQPAPQHSFNSPAFPPYPPPIIPHQQAVPQPHAAQYQASYPAPSTPATPGANLQELLANLRQPPASQSQAQHVALPPQHNRPTDLAGLLSNVAARQYNQAQPYPQHASGGQFANSNIPQGFQSHTPTQSYPQRATDLQGLVQQLQRNQR